MKIQVLRPLPGLAIAAALAFAPLTAFTQNDPTMGSAMKGEEMMESGDMMDGGMMGCSMMGGGMDRMRHTTSSSLQTPSSGLRDASLKPSFLFTVAANEPHTLDCSVCETDRCA
jgi:hypothetical protein